MRASIDGGASFAIDAAPTLTPTPTPTTTTTTSSWTPTGEGGVFLSFDSREAPAL